MPSSIDSPKVVRVSEKGQATIPKALRERFDIETPGEVFIYREGDRIVIEPVPSLDGLHGIHGDDDRDPGEVIERARELRAEDERRERERAERLRPDE
jgi:AbrB family looped-hinge helix DNA binding protein